ncbi:MAG: hypothetical protein AAGU03_06640 [Anaerolineaceae bacterium]
MLYQAYFMLKNFLGKFSQEEGQGLVEYALILVFISIVVIVILTQFEEPLQAVYQQVLDAITIE